MEVRAMGENYVSTAASISTIAVAVNGKRNCKSALEWALEKFTPAGRFLFKLLHVCPKITMVPTENNCFGDHSTVVEGHDPRNVNLVGNYLPISKVRDDVASAYKKEMEWQTNAMLLPYKQMCSRKKVEAEAVVIEADDVPEAISAEIAKFSISTLVVGASSRSLLRRKLRGHDVSSRISGCMPSFCTVYIISKGRLSSVRASSSETHEGAFDERSDSNISTNSSSSSTSSPQTEWTDTGSGSNNSFFRSSSLPDQRYQALLTINQAIVNKRPGPIDTHHSRSSSLYAEEDAMSCSLSYLGIKDGGSIASSSRSSQTDNRSWNFDQASMQNILTEFPSSGTRADVAFELEKLRVELRHARRMHEMAQNETDEASQHLNELSRHRMEEALKLKEMSLREEQARELARQEKEKIEAMKQEAEHVRECAKRESIQRKEVEMKATRDAAEKRKLEKALVCSDVQYKKFTWEEIVSATSSFSDDLRIGMGGYGMVYKCTLHHTTVAVKVLHSTEGHGNKQFQQELDILSRIRHPHLLLLLGACPDHGCLVYEYMENGSLDDRLFRKNNTPPIPWFERFRIGWEVATALVFLHNSTPKPIVHRDLKPANILLDRSFVSKIGDAGLSTLLPVASSAVSTMAKDTAPVGTFCYIDPEYQRTGSVSPKSDVYALGMVILQLLTAKPPLALAETVETALEEGRLASILDSKAGKWPIEETQELAALGLSCAELRRRDRPDLKDKVLPMLERLKEIAAQAQESLAIVSSIPPNHFLCPILQDVMDDPCVAADGYTYERRAIDLWLDMNDKSPMTNSPLPHKNLIPNYTLLSAIMEWKSRHQ